jgi:hypothetical protein
MSHNPMGLHGPCYRDSFTFSFFYMLRTTSEIYPKGVALLRNVAWRHIVCIEDLFIDSDLKVGVE